MAGRDSGRIGDRKARNGSAGKACGHLGRRWAGTRQRCRAPPRSRARHDASAVAELASLPSRARGRGLPPPWHHPPGTEPGSGLPRLHNLLARGWGQVYTVPIRPNRWGPGLWWRAGLCSVPSVRRGRDEHAEGSGLPTGRSLSVEWERVGRLSVGVSGQAPPRASPLGEREVGSCAGAGARKWAVAHPNLRRSRAASAVAEPTARCSLSFGGPGLRLPQP